MTKLKELLSNFWYVAIGFIIFIIIPGFLFLLIPGSVRYIFDVVISLVVLVFLLYGLACLLAWIFDY